MALKVKRIEVEGFRAFRGKVSLELGDGFTVVYGPPGSGKTSLVRAIEFALFGGTREVEARSLKREDLINDFCSEARVSVTLAGEEGEILVERVLARDGRSRLRVVVGSNELYDEVGEQYLQSKLGLSLRDFAWEIAVGYQELQMLVYSPPSARNRVMDELLGLSELRRLYRELSGSELKGYLKAVRDELAKYSGESLLKRYEALRASYSEVVSKRDALASELEKLKEQRRILDEKLTALRSKAVEARPLVEERGKLLGLLQSLGCERLSRMPVPDAELLREYAERFRNALSETLEHLYMGKDAETLRKIDVSNLDELLETSKNLLEKVKEYIVKMDYELRDERNEIRRLEERINELEDEIAELEAKISELEQYRAEYDAIVNKYGDPLRLAKRIAQLEIDIRAMQAEEGKVRCARALQELVLTQIKERGVASCPVCGSSVEKADALPRVEPLEAVKLKRERLEQELQALRDVESKLRRLEPELRLLEDYESRRENLSRVLDEQLDELQELRSGVEELESRLQELKRRLAELTRLYEQLENYRRRLLCAELQEKLRSVEKTINELGYNETELQKLSMEIADLDRKISMNEGRLNELNDKEKHVSRELMEVKIMINNFEKLNEKEKKITKLYNTLMSIKAALLEAHVELREKLAERLSEVASRILAAIETSGEYDAVSIQVQSVGPRSRRGHYAFLVRRRADGRYVSAFTRMSDGQRSLLALSLLLALRQLKHRNFAVLILDDAVPNVDDATKLAIANALSNLFGGFQIVLTTQSKVVAEALKASAVVANLEDFRGGVSGDEPSSAS